MLLNWIWRAGLAFVLAAALLFAVPVQAAPGTAVLEDPAELEAFLDGYMHSAMRKDHLPGAVVVVVKDGEIFLARGYGYADLDALEPVDPERSLFRPGSVTKLVTWTAVMQQVEAGRLDLDQDVNAYLDFEIPATYPEPVTLRHLLTHTPGFEDKGDGLFVLDPDALLSLEEYLKKNVPARVFPPGTIAAYSNYGTGLAGYLVQRVTGVPFEEYVERQVLQPLGMNSSTFRQPLPTSLAGDMANGYNFYNGEYYQGGFEYIAATPAGAMSAPGTDMARFMIAHLQGGENQGQRILSPAATEQMHTEIFTFHPQAGGMAHGFFVGYMNGLRVISHGGDTFLFHSGLFLIPEQNVGLYVSTNGASGGRLSQEVMRAFVDRYFPGEQAPAPQPAEGSAERLQPYLGEYSLARSNFSTFEKIISLFSQASVAQHPEGHVIVNIMGETRQFVEVSPGLLQDRLDPDNRLALRTDENGQAFLQPPIPFTFIKAPWYATSTFHSLILLLGLGLFLAAVIGWPLKALTAGRDRSPQPRLARLARWTAAGFGLLLLALVGGLVAILGNIDPAYGVPMAIFGVTEGLDVLLLIPYLLAIAGVGVVGFAVLAWVQGWWTVRARVFYSLLALAVVPLLWQMAFWKLWL